MASVEPERASVELELQLSKHSMANIEPEHDNCRKHDQLGPCTACLQRQRDELKKR